MRFEVDVAARVGDRSVACGFVAEGGVTVLFGPSGAGKTSVLHMIAGLRRPDRGRIVAGERVLFDADAGIDLPPEARGIGYVFQDSRLFPHRRVRANLTYATRGIASPGFAATVEMLDIGHLLARWPRSLSGGEARRVAIGRALLSDPRILLLDEPLSSLDAARRAEVEAAIVALKAQGTRPIVLVTHDAGEAERLGDRVVAIA